MNPSLLFKYSNSRFDMESVGDDNTVTVNFSTTNAASSGYVKMDEDELKELQTWIAIQLTKIKTTPKPKKKS